MKYHRLPLIDNSSAEFEKMLSISALERGVILAGIVVCGNNELEYMRSKNNLF